MSIEMEENATMELEKTTTKDVQKNTSADQLIMLAINENLDVEKLQALIDMKNAEEARQCKKDFDAHFTEMQKEFTPIEKTKRGYDYWYAPLPEMEKKYGPIIRKHGFSVRWRERDLENGKKRVIIVVSGWGHEDAETYRDLPQLEGTKRQSVVQADESTNAHGRRYTFKQFFGIQEIEKTKDGNLTYDQGVYYGPDIICIRECQSMDQLKKVFMPMWEKYKDDPQGQKVIAMEKDKKKGELKNANI
jgi:hypothetical protein